MLYIIDWRSLNRIEYTISLVFSRYINSTNFADVKSFVKFNTLKKSTNHCYAELLADPFMKIKSQKTENLAIRRI